jgi:hypothetical protein
MTARSVPVPRRARPRRAIVLARRVVAVQAAEVVFSLSIAQESLFRGHRPATAFAQERAPVWRE